MQILEGGSHEYSVKANWKLLVENSVDGYHAVSAHQRYFEMVMASGVEIDSAKLSQSVGLDLGNGHAVVAGGPDTGGLFGRPLSVEGNAERESRFEEFRAKYGDEWVDRMSGSRNLVIFPPNLVIIDLVMASWSARLTHSHPTIWKSRPGSSSRRRRATNSSASASTTF